MMEVTTEGSISNGQFFILIISIWLKQNASLSLIFV